TIVPIVTARAVVRWEPDRAERAVGRLRRVAREAAMQSRRAWLPELSAVEPFALAVARPGAVLAERGGSGPALGTGVTVLVGPEGGWEDEERAIDLPTVALGTEVLRAETAAVAAGTLFCALRAGIVGPQHERKH